MPFDFSQIVTPFRMQPGLRRVAPGAAQLTPARAGGRHLDEKGDIKNGALTLYTYKDGKKTEMQVVH